MYRDPRSGAHLYETLQQKIEINTFDPVLASLEMPPGAHYRSDFSEIQKLIKRNCTAEVNIIIEFYYITFCIVHGSFSVWCFVWFIEE